MNASELEVDGDGSLPGRGNGSRIGDMKLYHDFVKYSYSIPSYSSVVPNSRNRAVLVQARQSAEADWRILDMSSSVMQPN